MLECLINGEIADQLPVADRGLQYGDGLFETMAVFRGQPRFWQGHMDRLALGCGLLLPFLLLLPPLGETSWAPAVAAALALIGLWLEQDLFVRAGQAPTIS